MRRSLEQRLIAFGEALVDQTRAHIIIEPMQRASGFWFGGGNLVESPEGTLCLSGRYRNYGDSRTGLEAGARGLELAIFASEDRGKTFTKVLSFTKADLSRPEQRVLSIEGSALHFTEEGVELFISSEKSTPRYPDELQSFQKANTGIWSIDRLAAPTISGLAGAEVVPLLGTRDPRFLHVKDPVVYEKPDGHLLLPFCTHPFNWTSSNTGYVSRSAGQSEWTSPNFDFFRRGFTWDVAISRITALLRVPKIGPFTDEPSLVLAFYDGGESMRNLEPHAKAVKRPRGYSCEEIGGLAVAPEEDLGAITRLSKILPLFVSPYGTGSSRYVDVLQTEEGFYATWEQSQPDLSQPLVVNFLSWDAAEELLA